MASTEMNTRSTSARRQAQPHHGAGTRGAVLAVAAVLLLVPAAPTRAEILDLAWNAQGRMQMERPVAPGKFLEVCGPLAAGQRVTWSFEAAAPLDFNVHYHQGKDVVYPAQLAQATRAADTLVAATRQDYCWMWTNRSAAAVALKLTLQR